MPRNLPARHRPHLEASSVPRRRTGEWPANGFGGADCSPEVRRERRAKAVCGQTDWVSRQMPNGYEKFGSGEAWLKGTEFVVGGAGAVPRMLPAWRRRGKWWWSVLLPPVRFLVGLQVCFPSSLGLPLKSVRC